MESPPPRAFFVHTTVANEEDARRLAAHVIASRTAACVNIGAPVTSVFRWDEAAPDARGAQVQTEREIPLVIKTTPAAYPALEQAIREVHPYTLPEIVVVPVTRGYGPFLEWIGEAVEGGA